MTEQGITPENLSLKDLMDCCERYELVEDINGGPPSNNQPKSNGGSNKKRDGKKRKGDAITETFECMLHGRNKSHNTEQCKTLQKQAERMMQTWEAQHPSHKRQRRNPKNSEELHVNEQDPAFLEYQEFKRFKEMKNKRKEMEKTVDEFERMDIKDKKGDDDDEAVFEA